MRDEASEIRQVIGVSGGKDSTALALRLRETHPDVDYDFLCTPTGNELEDMGNWWDRLGTLLGKPLIRLQPISGDGLAALIERFNGVPNWRQRWCTRILKIEPTVAWLKAHAPCVQYVGLRADEDADERAGIYGDIPGVEQRYPFREWGWGIDEVWDYLAERGIRVPKRTDCAWCYGQRLGEWYRLWKDRPAVYEKAAAYERKVGHTFRSPKRDTWPAGLDALGEEFKRRIPKGARIPLDLFDQGGEEDQSCRVCRL